MEYKPLIAVVDDEEDFLRGIIRTLESKFKSFEIKGFSSSKDALYEIEKGNISVLLTDLRMPGISGMELLEKTIEKSPSTCVVMLTGFASVENAVEALKKGAWDFITKPVERDELFHTIEKAVKHHELAFENQRLQEILSTMESRENPEYSSVKMKNVWERVTAISGTDYTVLVTGESGSGKEHIAREIHKLSKRKNQSCHSINCAAIPEQLMESELFGHVKGAFTGAERDRRGFFMAAHKGTLILDEIGDISHGIQVKLLKFLEDREVKPVGSSVSKKVDVRIIALTNQNLEQKIKDGSFREDLYYRLNVLELKIPPLRERMEDIPVLTKRFMDKTCEELGTCGIEIDHPALSYISRQKWHGNVRELRNFVRRLAVFSGGGKIDLPLVHIVEGKDMIETGKSEGGITKYKDAKKEVLDAFSKDYLTTLLEQTNGNVSMASRISGLERASIQKIIKRLDIDILKYRKN